MYFLDGAGFFSLICLLIQCILAWIFTGFFLVLSPGQAPWLQRWRIAFAGLGLALTAVAVRFTWAQYHIVGAHVIEEGDAAARLAYAVYFGGKAAFLWFLLGGIAALRQRPWPSTRLLPIALVGLGFAVGASVPTVEWALLLQAPLVVVACLYGWRSLEPAADEPRDVGRGVVRGVLAALAVVWLTYAIAVVDAGLFVPDTTSPWNIVLQLNSLIDLSLQVPLAAGLIVVVMHDAQQATVTAQGERDRLRAQVERDEKLRSLSTLVGGIAHELNNPLTAILGYAEDLTADAVDVRAHAAQVVTEQAERCRQIVERMSSLGGGQPFKRRPVVVQALIERVVRGFERQVVVVGVTFEIELEPGVHIVSADAAAIEQVLTNLLTNALHATPRGGRILLTTRAAEGRLRFVVDDTGPGVAIADRTRIFEPFWTSKRNGHGTGIGLAIAETVARAHGSGIAVGDAPVGGARFEFTLPLMTADDLPHDAGTAPGGEAGEPALEVLLVDDEAPVRAVIRRWVESRGWSATESASGEEALDVLLRGDRQFDVVVCDLRMPGITGVQLHDALQGRAPHLLQRFLFLTGDLSSAEAREFRARCRRPIVTKPFAGAELVAQLREVALAARRA